MQKLKLLIVLPVLACSITFAAPSKPLPMPLSEKAVDNRAAGDPTAAAASAHLQGAPVAGRSGPAPFQKYSIPDPLEASASLPVRTAVTDAQAPVNANSGRPMPVLK